MGSSQGHELSKRGAEMRGIKFALPCNWGAVSLQTMTEEKIIIRDLRRKEKFIIDDEYLNGYAKICGIFATGVYVSLCRHADKEQKAFPSIKRMAAELAISESSVKRGLKRLDEHRIIVRERKGKMLTNRYYLLDKSEWSMRIVGDSDGSVRPIIQFRQNHHTVPAEPSIVRKHNSKETQKEGMSGKPTDWGFLKEEKRSELKLSMAITELTPRENAILKMRFGLDETKATHTLEEVAKEFGVTRERIRQIETKAIEKIREKLKRKEWNLEIEIEKLLKDQRRHIQVIGIWIKEKGLKPENVEQMQSIIMRNLRPAQLLNGYTNENIHETITVIKNTEYLRKFTLETVAKYIDEVIAQKKKQGRKIIRFEEIRRSDGSAAMRPIYEELKQ